MSRNAVLVTGANGYIGNAVARAFCRAGWRTFGLIRRAQFAADLARNEIHPVIGTPDDLAFLDGLKSEIFDVAVSNTETWPDAVGHFENVRTMLRDIGRCSSQAGVRPLMMFTSGCKDYGHQDLKHGDPGLAPHTKESPLRPPELLSPRTNLGIALLETQEPNFDATVLRPTIIYGYASGHYRTLFAQAAQSQGVLMMTGDPDATMHSMHVDDCAAAYVALAEHKRRAEVAGQAFNLSNAMYETVREIGEALAASYGLELAFTPDTEARGQLAFLSLANYWQWVSSDKVRALTGWSERKPGFAEAIDDYRRAYEAALQP